MRITVTHTLDDLESDLRTIALRAPMDMARVVRENAVEGNRIAKAFASEQHTMNSNYDVHYPKRFSAEVVAPLTWEYGPEGRPQGEMSFEHGSRNQPPHLDLARSVDIIGPRFARDVAALPDDWFWPS